MNEPMQFCGACGAGVGQWRREGEGTCPQCDHAVAVAEIKRLESRLAQVRREALEEAAKVCDHEAARMEREPVGTMARYLAHTIRERATAKP